MRTLAQVVISIIARIRLSRFRNGMLGRLALLGERIGQHTPHAPAIRNKSGGPLLAGRRPVMTARTFPSGNR
jgi:hypothetical protein